MTRALDRLLLLALISATWHRIAWAPLGRVMLADLAMIAFLSLFAVARLRDRDGGLDPQVATALCLCLAIVAVWLASYQSLASNHATTEWAKGALLGVMRLAFVVCAAAQLARGSRRAYLTALTAFIAGFAINGAYGVVQYAAQVGLGVNIDAKLITPYFSGAVATGTNVFGQVTSVDANGAIVQSAIYRMVGLTNDPNHIGILLLTPVVLLAAIAVAGAARERTPLLALAAILLLAAALSQSRSAALGLVAGAVVLALGLRARLATRALAAPAAVLGAAAAVVLYAERSYVESVVKARLTTSTSGSEAHTQVYGLVGPILRDHPLFGLGYNTFALRYEQLGGKANFGPHSLYVELLTETGLVGTAVYLLFVGFVVVSLLRLRAAARGAADGLAEGVALGLLAAIAATLAANAFYLTTVFPSWFDVLMFGIAAAPALGLAPAARAARAAPAPAPA